MDNPTPSGLYTFEVNALIHAVAETMLRLEHDQLHGLGMGADLAYSINPLATDGCNDFLARLAEEYEKQKKTFDPNGRWVQS